MTRARESSLTRGVAGSRGLCPFPRDMPSDAGVKRMGVFEIIARYALAVLFSGIVCLVFLVCLLVWLGPLLALLVILYVVLGSRNLDHPRRL